MCSFPGFEKSFFPLFSNSGEKLVASNKDSIDADFWRKIMKEENYGLNGKVFGSYNMKKRSDDSGYSMTLKEPSTGEVLGLLTFKDKMWSKLSPFLVGKG